MFFARILDTAFVLSTVIALAKGSFGCAFLIVAASLFWWSGRSARKRRRSRKRMAALNSAKPGSAGTSAGVSPASVSGSFLTRSSNEPTPWAGAVAGVAVGAAAGMAAHTTFSSVDAHDEFMSASPNFNIDGTPMIGDSSIDVNGNAYGITQDPYTPSDDFTFDAGPSFDSGGWGGTDVGRFDSGGTGGMFD